jgi:hypothetical protein
MPVSWALASHLSEKKGSREVLVHLASIFHPASKNLCFTAKA